MLVVVALLAVACGGDEGRPFSEGAAGDPDRPEPVTLTDQRGKEVTLEQPAQRIATIPMPAASMLIALDGSADRLVAMHAGSASAMRGGLLAELFPGVADVPSDVANETFAPNVESILAVRPDLVVQWGDRGEDVIAPLENAGLAVVGLTYGTQEDLEAWIRLFGDAIGRPERAEALLEWHQEAMEGLRAASAELGGERPKVLYFNRLRDDLRVAGRGTYNDFYIDLAGGRNAAAEVEGLVPVNAEQVARWDPDIILVGNFDEGAPADVYAQPAWQDLSAVRDRRVYQVPVGGYRWDPPSQESPLMWWWLAELTHPDTFDLPLRAEIERRYRFLYGAEVTDAQIDEVLQRDENAGASGYDRVVAD